MAKIRKLQVALSMICERIRYAYFALAVMPFAASAQVQDVFKVATGDQTLDGALSTGGELAIKAGKIIVMSGVIFEGIKFIWKRRLADLAFAIIGLVLFWLLPKIVATFFAKVS